MQERHTHTSSLCLVLMDIGQDPNVTLCHKLGPRTRVTHTCRHAHTHTFTHALIHSHMHACTHTCDTRTHARLHTHTVRTTSISWLECPMLPTTQPDLSSSICLAHTTFLVPGSRAWQQSMVTECGRHVAGTNAQQCMYVHMYCT